MTTYKSRSHEEHEGHEAQDNHFVLITDNELIHLSFCFYFVNFVLRVFVVKNK